MNKQKISFINLKLELKYDVLTFMNKELRKKISLHKKKFILNQIYFYILFKYA